MGLFDDVSQFLENRIDEFLKNNPHLELQALDEKLREQEVETMRLVGDLKARQTIVEQDIMKTAQEIKRWNGRISKAKAAGRQDLVEPAQAHEAMLLRQGNQHWGQMELLRDRITQTQTVQKKIHQQRQELQVKIEQAKAARAAAAAQTAAQTANSASSQPQSAWSGTWSTAATPRSMDPLESEFAKWEADEELEQLKRNMK
ncbi:TIGR04376 family protein [filamentous cyanobacterium LEGE 11480]|uniref:TIGR04376 family protein n=2 Tax=Romeriopsis TaxID=2992131 RepID=A0A928VLE1_9CYAN|nr:TIGR04376 family protein [Romeriopsis navalis LEGE 11480]